MNDDQWVADQQRAHNYRSFKFELPPLRTITRRRQPFTIEQLLAGERWAAGRIANTARRPNTNLESETA